jgi:hypothetical protein
VRRASLLLALVVLGALALPSAAAAGARSDHGDEIVVFAGDALVSGRIDGDLVIATGQARLLPSAYVSGDVRYGDERPAVAGAATVRGEVTGKDWEDSIDFLPFVFGFSFWLMMSGSALLLGCLLLLIAPRAADAIYARSRERVGSLIAIGIAIAIGLPLAAILVAVTVVGIALSVAIFLAMLPLAAIAYVTSAWALGRRLVGAPRNRFLSFLAGLAILRLIALVPILGGIVGFAAVVFGFGLIGAAIEAAREPRQPTPAPARSPGS